MMECNQTRNSHNEPDTHADNFTIDTSNQFTQHHTPHHSMSQCSLPNSLNRLHHASIFRCRQFTLRGEKQHSMRHTVNANIIFTVAYCCPHLGNEHLQFKEGVKVSACLVLDHTSIYNNNNNSHLIITHSNVTRHITLATHTLHALSSTDLSKHSDPPSTYPV